MRQSVYIAPVSLIAEAIGINADPVDNCRHVFGQYSKVELFAAGEIGKQYADGVQAYAPGNGTLSAGTVWPLPSASFLFALSLPPPSPPVLAWLRERFLPPLRQPVLFAGSLAATSCLSAAASPVKEAQVESEQEQETNWSARSKS